ncbi:MAG TPA: recombinase family protein [Acidimicrobiales bacterium]
MSKTVAYVRVSTDDQVEFSPDAQEKRCRDLAKLRGLGPVTVLADEGWSGKNLVRPAVHELLRLVELGQVSDLIVWRWDRLSRDQGDFATLVKLFDRHDIKVHSVNEGDLDLASASGRMQIGVHGVFAQYYRDQIVENTRMGQRQAAEQGRWLNRAPTGYDMINGYLVPNDDAPLVQRAFALRALGGSYPSIASEVGIKFSTVRSICLNRVYLGDVRLGPDWFRGIHPPLVNLEQFNAAQRPHQQGRRRSKDLLSGLVRCGLCGRVACVNYNERNQAIYKCWHRGQGCTQSGRSANGLHRAAVLGLRVLRDDKDLQASIREQLNSERRVTTPKGPGIASAITAAKAKEKKLLDLYYADKIDADHFAEEEGRLRATIATLESERRTLIHEGEVLEAAINQFDRLGGILNDLNFEVFWSEATEAERRVLVEDLVDEIRIYPDQITVQVAGAPPILVTLDEVGLRGGTRSMVSETGLEPTRP